MVYVTGDIHGDWSRFKKTDLRKLKKKDILLVCGDFGFIWDNSPEEQKRLRALTKKRYQILFVEGTHDNYDLIRQAPVVELHGGKAHHLGGNLYHLMRGEVYTLEGMRIFAFGGGESADREMRESTGTWWVDELPTQEELDEGSARLDAVGRSVDYIITHEPPASVGGFMDMDANKVNLLNAYFNQISASCTYRRWFFGSLHLDKVITGSQTAVFREVIPLG